jgi:hypothetical protein
MTVTVNGKRTESQPSAIRCEICGNQGATISISDQGHCAWFCPFHQPSSSANAVMPDGATIGHHARSPG